ncbi:MAG: hypothetical protein COX79_01650 [Candidatus Levybacteria bacterium CG_4_10_14_0_2_um_filter_36_16]|nr:MAG: hypothetical protein AUK12_03380 [Candidatus Levybacteria bacterium CG2_30_37_29]PIR79614.1 MAG: hypothetical protein COU26_00275 [Candidatus Levybacteria bacterium CG10_big_fil_rev_8_21_14_0_10_36_30]PIZ97597.1 MAG: hypothetical protein COX79_01650 [Candidatus Levybacteria bacterium CG_4_10_14_0_2_um_filter_36_16]PJA90226.1 MAG: hypothetical protein CO136_02720 [Candidatus Levybacteria bacterium CG_4_9_14_3_um_filter_36_7]
MKRKNNISKKLITNRQLLFFLIAILSVAIMLLPLFYNVQLKQFRSLGLIGIVLINFFGSATVFLPTPAIVSVGIGGTLYNPIFVAMASAVGSSLGETVGFVFGYSSKKVINQEEKRLIYKLFKYVFHKHGSWLIITLSFIPNPIFDAVGIFAGVAQYPIKKFLLFVFIGRFLRDIMIAFFFSRI